MQIEKSPFFKKPFIPWHASKSACLIKMLMMLGIALFAIDGVKIARQMEAYNDYLWVPVLLLALSVYVFAVNLIRVIKQFSGDFAT